MLGKYHWLGKLAFAGMTVLIWFVFCATTVFACTPPPITPWYKVSLSILTTDPPKDSPIQISDHGDHIKIQNATSVPIFVETATEGYEEFVGDISINLIDWAEFPNFDAAPIFISATGENEQFARLMEFDQSNVIADNRPDQVEIPTPKEVNVRLLIDGKPYNLQLQVVYELNPGYDPHSVDDHNSACVGYPYFMDITPHFDYKTGIGILFLLLVIIITLAILKKRQK
jgi:hypothetical protein